MNEQALVRTDFHFEGQKSVYHGKVRDVYTLENDVLVMVATDRISAFDVVLPWGIPGKGAVLNTIAADFLDKTRDLCPNWKHAVPHPMVTVGLRCAPYPVEMVVRAYLCGHAWREYQRGVRSICGVSLPDGLVENQPLPEPIITPTTKASVGHDEDISREQIIAQGLVLEEEYSRLEKYSLDLFRRGTTIAAQRGLLLMDTKYEFGSHEGEIYLIDEIHTPDSSRYVYADGFEERLAAGSPQRQLSKEFVRQWLIDEGFTGQPGQLPPSLSPEKRQEITARYCELYEGIVGEQFHFTPSAHLEREIESTVRDWLREHHI